MTQRQFDPENIELICEVDEQWPFVKSKQNQRWLWYAWSPENKCIIAHAFGRRDTATLKELLALLVLFNISKFCTDNYRLYSSEIPPEQHIIGKHFTQRIERQNLTLRTRIKRLNRKTICYSKSEAMHDKVIGTFIEREFYGSQSVINFGP